MQVSTCAQGQSEDVTELVKPGEWFNILVTWYPDPEDEDSTRRDIYFNGKILSMKQYKGKPNLIGEEIYMDVPKNGGQPWRGAMDEFAIWNYPLSAEERAAESLSSQEEPSR